MFERELSWLQGDVKDLPHLLGRVFTWFRSALLAPLPPTIANRLNGDAYIIRILWEGADTELPSDQPFDIELPSEAVFWTSTTLPRSMRQKIRDAVRLRMDELSPVPPQEATFAVGPPAVDDDRLTVPVAIIHTKTLDEVAAAAGDGLRKIHTSAPDQTSVVLHDDHPGDQSIRRMVSHPALAVFVVLVAILSAWGVWSDRKASALELAIREQTQAVRQHQAVAADAQTYIDAYQLVPAQDLARRWQSALPPGAIAETLSVREGTFRLSGFVPSESDAPDILGDVTRTDTPRPGWDQFSVQVQPEDQP